MVRSRRGHTSTLDIEEAFIMAIHDNNQAFTYDLKDQLIGAQGDAYGSFEWEYDALGNRTQEVHGDTTIAYSYGTGNNRLVSEAFGDTVNSYSYDYAGSMTRKDYYYEQSLLGGSTYNNNDDSRLTSVAQSGVVETNYYDHLGQRVLKDDAGAHTVYVYDIFGNLIGEYIPGSDAVREWVYLGSHRLAMLHANMSVGVNPPECGGLPSPPEGCSRMIPSEGEQSSAPFNWVLIGLCPVMTYSGFKFRRRKKVLILIFASGVSIIAFMMSRKAKTQENPTEAVYYYHNDHLGTPKVLTDSTGTVVWEAIYEPFGSISQLLTSQISNPFRFPGQYDDEWTGMYYNINRFYISGLAKYNRPDPRSTAFPIAKSAYNYTNSNPYIYVFDNPIMLKDPFGLCAKCDDCPSGKWSGSLGSLGGHIIIAGASYNWGFIDCWGNNTKMDIGVECYNIGTGLGGWLGLQGSIPLTSNCCNASDFSGWDAGLGFSADLRAIFGGGWGFGVSLASPHCLSIQPSFGFGLDAVSKVYSVCNTTIKKVYKN